MPSATHALPGSAAIPAPYRDRQEMAYMTGRRIVEMVREDLRPSAIRKLGLTYAALQSVNPALVCVALTGYGLASELERAQAAGFDDHLVKPVSVAVIRETIQALLSRQQYATG